MVAIVGQGRIHYGATGPNDCFDVYYRPAAKDVRRQLTAGRRPFCIFNYFGKFASGFSASQAVYREFSNPWPLEENFGLYSASGGPAGL